MTPSNNSRPDSAIDRRDFLRTTTATVAGLAFAAPALAAPTPRSTSETAVKELYQSLTDAQKKAMCFDWDYKDPKRGLLRGVVSANWMITPHKLQSDFYTKKQQHLAQDVFKGLLNPEWHARFEQEVREDCGGSFGCEHAIAIFGTPGSGPFEMVLTGRHMTLRADGNSTDKAAFGGPIFYGHQGERDEEESDHPNNVFWSQALVANKVYQMLDGKQRTRALIDIKRGGDNPKQIERRTKYLGLPVADMTGDQKAEVQKVLHALVEPFRVEDREEALAGLKKHGGLDGCHLAFYRDGDIGKDEVWDNWRLEGPGFAWYFRGEPHVHVWVNVAGV